MPERRIQMKSCKEMAKQWGVTERTVTTFCKTGKIPGVVKRRKELADSRWSRKTCRRQSTVRKVCKKKRKKKQESHSRSEYLITYGHSRNIIMWTRQE